MEGLKLLKNTIFQRHVLVGLSCREKVEYINLLVFSPNTVDAADTLHDLICSKFALMNEDLADTADGLPPVSVSAGIAFGADAADAGALFEHADHALYESKHKGRCRFTFFDAAETT